MQRSVFSQYEEVHLTPQQEHDIYHQPGQPSKPHLRQINAMEQGSLLGVKHEVSDVTLNYEQGGLIPLKAWKYYGWWADLAFAYRTNSDRYRDDSSHRHRDVANRVEMLKRHDAYLSAESGELCPLVVQCTDDVYEESRGATTWCRTYVRKPSPYYIRLAIWTVGRFDDSKSWSNWCTQVLRSFPAALATSIVCLGDLESSVSYYGKYPPVLHRYWGDAKVWSNLRENTSPIAFDQLSQTSWELPQSHRNKTPYRLLRPRHLCLLTSDSWKHIKVTDWENEPGNEGRKISYLFVAYFSEHFSSDIVEDMKDLHKIGMAAARKAGVDAFWVSASCMREEEELETDIYRISDVLCGAERMIIAVSTPKYDASNASLRDALREFGSRIWTFPEVLLSPGKRILVYIRGGDLSNPYDIPKNQVASVLWGDGDISRQLIDHYLGTIILSRIELAVLALECLYARKTTEWAKGDHAYALMGLLRIRPPIDKTDSQFQAFARLSLANDNDKLLERYICTLPKKVNQPWWNMTDAYDSQLWDIDPVCQVAAICDNETVVLDGARGATIAWDGFGFIRFTSGPSWKRFIASLLIRFGWNCLLSGVLLTYHGLRHLLKIREMESPDNQTEPEFVKFPYYFLIGCGLVFLLIWLATAPMSPFLIRTLLGGKIQDIQGAFYGVEGYLNPETVESLVLGANFGRFQWSAHGSLLSRSMINEHKEKVGIDPRVDVDNRRKVEAAKVARIGDMRIFTLVDTFNLEVTIFEAIRPPNVLVFCGSEGGMQRAVACSYDWTTQTFYRETVLRVPTESLERASRMSRFRMGIKRPSWETVPGKSQKRTIASGFWTDLGASLRDEMR